MLNNIFRVPESKLKPKPKPKSSNNLFFDDILMCNSFPDLGLSSKPIQVNTESSSILLENSHINHELFNLIYKEIKLNIFSHNESFFVHDIPKPIYFHKTINSFAQLPSFNSIVSVKYDVFLKISCIYSSVGYCLYLILDSKYLFDHDEYFDDFYEPILFVFIDHTSYHSVHSPKILNNIFFLIRDSNYFEKLFDTVCYDQFGLLYHCMNTVDHRLLKQKVKKLFSFVF
jgi:hypothetical protein